MNDDSLASHTGAGDSPARKWKRSEFAALWRGKAAPQRFVFVAAISGISLTL